MKTYILRRILQMIPVFFGILFLLFLIVELSPGGPMTTMIDPRATAAQKKELADKLGVNDPMMVKFGRYIVNALQGDFGTSFSHKKPVADVIKAYMGPTLMLSVASLIFAIIIGVPCGIISAVKKYTWVDNALTVFSLIGISIPAFFFGLLLLKAFAVDNRWFPLFGLKSPLLRSKDTFVIVKDMAWHLVLPTIVLGMGSAASFMRYTRSSMLEVIKQDYIRTARAKGLSEKVVIYKHAFRNAMIPIITLLGFWVPGLLSGAVTTETVFGLPGLGKIAIEATMNRNYPLIIGEAAMLAVLTLFGALIADMLYALADPRVKFD